MESGDYLSSSFRALTEDKERAREGYEPLRWQRRLFEEYFSQNRIPSFCDLPTGMGKTNVIHLWLIALRQQMREGRKERLPIRLVYVVDRRTVIDQATTIAENIKGKPGGDGLCVSTLRGQRADNRDWAEDPSRPAIIIGTVDMIGSRLLFSGYRSSYKSRPLDAGMLGQDTLLVLDEAHLSEPFAKLVQQIGDQGEFQRGQGTPMRVMCMSASGGGDDPDRFKLEPSDLEGTPEENPIVQRYEAKKWVTVHAAGDWKSVEKHVIEEAARLAGDGARVVVFVRRPDDAVRIGDGIRGKLKLSTDAVEVLTGTMRGLERDGLLGKLVFKRFLDGDEKPQERAEKGPCVLVSTSAGEVGFDLNADHMVCDAAPLDSMIQRLGRVNRRGYRNATVEVFPAAEKGAKKGASDKPKHTFESATAAAIECLKRLEKSGDGDARSTSPKAMAELREKLTEDELRAACAPRPATVELTDILLDAWSMTTIVKPMPGRPPVAAWLRGVEAEAAETTIAWRAELDRDGFEQLDPDDVEDWFDAHRVLPHETLSVPTNRAKDWLLRRWNNLPVDLREKVGKKLCVIDRTGLRLVKVTSLVEELERNRDSIVDAQVVLPACFGGVRDGMLDDSEPDPNALDDPKSSDVADERGRYRAVCPIDADGECEALTRALPGDLSGFVRWAVDLPSDGDGGRRLESYVPARDRREFGTREQQLWHHVELVTGQARGICERLGLSDLRPLRKAAELAAKWHDHGKDREVWQRAVGGGTGGPALGKSGGRMGRVPGGYRHEFGSLREFIDGRVEGIADEVLDLALHIIAAHHGRARPHFPKGGFDPCARGRSPEIAADVVRRFARLQRKYGYWQLAWLENLLRCADAMASGEDGKT